MIGKNESSKIKRETIKRVSDIAAHGKFLI